MTKGRKGVNLPALGMSNKPCRPLAASAIPGGKSRVAWLLAQSLGKVRIVSANAAPYLSGFRLAYCQRHLLVPFVSPELQQSFGRSSCHFSQPRQGRHKEHWIAYDPSTCNSGSGRGAGRVVRAGALRWGGGQFFFHQRSSTSQPGVRCRTTVETARYTLGQIIQDHRHHDPGAFEAYFPAVLLDLPKARRSRELRSLVIGIQR